jgi:hypothetical protein
MDAASRLQLEKQLRDARSAEIERREIANKLEVQRNRSGATRRTVRGAGPPARRCIFWRSEIRGLITLWMTTVTSS